MRHAFRITVQLPVLLLGSLTLLAECGYALSRSALGAIGEIGPSLYQTQRPLTLQQIEQLLKIGTPDRVIAGEVHRRGISFKLDQTELSRLRNRGAGAQTIEALSVYLPKCSIRLSSTPSGSLVLIDGVSRGLTGDVETVIGDLEPGNYTVTVRKKNYRDGVYPITLSPGETIRLTARLTVDPAFVQQLINDVQTAYAGGRYREAIDKARQLLAIDSSNAIVLGVAAESRYMLNDFDGFGEFALKAIDAGGTIEIPLLHYHALVSVPLHPVRLVITGGGFSFNPQVANKSDCIFTAFTISALDIRGIDVPDNNNVEIGLAVLMRDPRNARKIAQLKLFDRESAPASKDRNRRKNKSNEVVQITSRPEAWRALTAVRGLLQYALQAKASSAPVLDRIERPGGVQAPGAENPWSAGAKDYTGNKHFRLVFPRNWHETSSDQEVTLAPPEGTAQVNGQTTVSLGVISGIAQTTSTSLQRATDGFINSLAKANPLLRRQGTTGRNTISGREALSVGLSNVNELTKLDEVVVLHTAFLRNGAIFYFMVIAPQREYSSYQRAFETILRSIRFTD